MTTPTQGEHAQTEALDAAQTLEYWAKDLKGLLGSELLFAAAKLRSLHGQVAALTAAPVAQADWTQPTTVAQRLGDAVQLLCGGKRPPEAMVAGWLDHSSEELQSFCAEHGPSWAQGIGLIDAAMVMVDQPTEITTIEHPDRDHEHRATEQPAAAPSLKRPVQPVYLVATGNTRNGMELYERHDKMVHMADVEVLYKTPELDGEAAPQGVAYAELPSTCAEAFRSEFCPYKGAPDPWIVWRAAWQSALRASHGQAPAGAAMDGKDAWRLHCPFCGGEYTGRTSHKGSQVIECQTCLARGPQADDADAAQSAWATRANQPTTTAQAAPAADYDHGPQSLTVQEAARHVGKWLNERPNRQLDLRDVAMLVAHVQAPAWVTLASYDPEGHRQAITDHEAGQAADCPHCQGLGGGACGSADSAQATCHHCGGSGVAQAAPAADNWKRYAKDGETAQQCIERHRSEHDALLGLLADARAKAPAAGAVAEPIDPSITLDFKQSTELLEMFGGEPGLVTLQRGGENSHSGAGLYAYYSDMPEEGAEFLGAEPSDEAAPTPAAQADSQPAPVPEWLPFSKRTQIADRHGVKVTAEFNALVRDVIQTYLETHADRAARAPADSVLEDADPIRALIAQHAAILDQNESAYFELCYHRVTGWMAWITDKPLCMPPVINPDREVLAQGQGDTADEACADAARKQGDTHD